MVTKKDAEAPLVDHAPDGVALTDAERKTAMKEGAKEDAKETGKAVHHALTDGIQLGAPPVNPFYGSDEIQQYADIIDLGLDEFKKVIAGKTDRQVPEAKRAGLLALERNGKNRTDYVKALLASLPIDDPYEVPGAGGPDYTNDVTAVSKL